MTYWKDRRDDLEELYPTCTSFCRYHAQYSPEWIELIPCGVVFLMAFGSQTAEARFKFACYALEDYAPWNRFQFHVVDVAGLPEDHPFKLDNPSGEDAAASWVRAGAIIASLGSDWSGERFHELTALLVRGGETGDALAGDR